MFTRMMSFVDLQHARRWKVEYFCADKSGSKATLYPLVALRELFTERKESLDPQQHSDHVFNYIGLEHVEGLTGDLADSYAPRPGREILSRCKVFREGDLLYGRLRPVLNKVFLATAQMPEGICSGEFYVLIPDRQRLLPCFARALLASRYVQDVAQGMTTGSALPRLQLSDLLDIEIPLPPMETQCQFEASLVEHQRQRKLRKAEVIEGPALLLESLFNALEDGSIPDFSYAATGPSVDFSQFRLPESADTLTRGRGRPLVR